MMMMTDQSIYAVHGGLSGRRGDDDVQWDIGGILDDVNHHSHAIRQETHVIVVLTRSLDHRHMIMIDQR